MKIAYGLLIAMLLSGCGGKGTGPRRYSVKGEVTFKGQPIPVGTIIFSPDRTQGHQGPGVSIDFSNGKFSVDRKSGVTAGAHTVTIFGFDGKVPARSISAADVGNALFQVYETSHNFPASDSKASFEIPATTK